MSRRIYSPAEVARYLKRCGFAVLAVAEGDDAVDGELTLSPTVHVTVPDYDPPAVVRECEGGEEFEFFPVRGNLAKLVSDLKACGIHPASGGAQ